MELRDQNYPPLDRVSTVIMPFVSVFWNSTRTVDPIPGVIRGVQPTNVPVDWKLSLCFGFETKHGQSTFETAGRLDKLKGWRCKIRSHANNAAIHHGRSTRIVPDARPVRFDPEQEETPAMWCLCRKHRLGVLAKVHGIRRKFIHITLTFSPL